MGTIVRNRALQSIAIGAVVMAIPTFVTAYGETLPLTAEGVIQEIVGNTIQYQNDEKDQVQEFFAPDGTIHGWSRKAGKYRSQWQIRFGNYLCIVAGSALESGCVRVLVLPRAQVEFKLDIGETEGPFELLHGNPRNL
jgi:hypothetical protein